MISFIQKPVDVSLIISRSSCSMVVSLENLLRPNTLKYSCSSCFIILPRFVLICLVVRSTRSCFFHSMCLCIVSFHGPSFTDVNIVSFDNASSSNASHFDLASLPSEYQIETKLDVTSTSHTVQHGGVGFVEKVSSADDKSNVLQQVRTYHTVGSSKDITKRLIETIRDQVKRIYPEDLK